MPQKQQKYDCRRNCMNLIIVYIVPFWYNCALKSTVHANFLHIRVVCLFVIVFIVILFACCLAPELSEHAWDWLQIPFEKPVSSSSLIKECFFPEAIVFERRTDSVSDRERKMQIADFQSKHSISSGLWYYFQNQMSNSETTSAITGKIAERKWAITINIFLI